MNGTDLDKQITSLERELTSYFRVVKDDQGKAIEKYGTRTVWLVFERYVYLRNLRERRAV